MPPVTAGSLFTITTAEQVDKARLDDFLCRLFGETKGEFLRRYGAWWHRGNRNRYPVVDEAGAIAAYYTTTPARCLINGTALDTLWWIDLIVDPAYRQRGLQTLMDDEVRHRPGLKLGIPNYFHSKILARHGWQVRGDLRNDLLPLRPAGIRFLHTVAGRRGQLLRAAARLLSPGAAILRRYLAAYRPRTARAAPNTTAAELATIYDRYRPDDLITTCRQTDFLQWRYLDAPYRAELTVYLAGPADAPSHYLISRHVTFRGLPATRILDIFGDFNDTAGLDDIIRLAVRDAVRAGSNQVTAMAAIPDLRRILRRAGFLISIPVYFCYHALDQATLDHIEHGRCYWTLGDSDNDPPY